MNEPSPEAASQHCNIVLFDADGADCDMTLDKMDLASVKPTQLLWIDVGRQDDDLLLELMRRLDLPPEALASLQKLGTGPLLQNFGESFLVHVIAVEHQGSMKFDGLGLAVMTGLNFVLTVHHRPVPFIQQLRDRHAGETEIGVLKGESFTAALLDWQLSTYFDAVSHFETEVDRLEVDILSGKSSRRLEDLRVMRRGASRLRRMLAPHRMIFAGLSRPDFRPRREGDITGHFLALEQHYERAMDVVEHARDLVVGSFELFTSQIAYRTNETMKTLTFVTVLLGVLAVMAGVLGMNFAADFFKTDTRGFWFAVGGMLAIAVIATAAARWRRWL